MREFAGLALRYGGRTGRGRTDILRIWSPQLYRLSYRHIKKGKSAFYLNYGSPPCGGCQADLTAISAFYSSTALAYETFCGGGRQESNLRLIARGRYLCVLSVSNTSAI
nr:MAG TPA: hypothetical protein [Caudoviricetes sp.]